MAVSDRIWRMEGRQLERLRANAERILRQGPAGRQAEAQELLDAIAEEQARRERDDCGMGLALQDGMVERLRARGSFLSR